MEKHLDRLLLIFDVDGVIRDSIEAPADSRVIQEIKSLLAHPFIHVCFLSGTPIINDPSLELWRRGNVPLTAVFGEAFDEELEAGTVSMYGMLGGQRLNAKGHVDILDAYPLEVSFELGRLVVEAFLKEILVEGSKEKQHLASDLLAELKGLKLTHPLQPSDATAKEFASIAEAIRSELDPEFRLISNGATVETHVSSPLYNPLRSFTFVKENLPPLLFEEAPHFSRGIAKRGSQEFHFLLISKSHKGHASERIIQERAHPGTLIMTVGDTQLDFLMHQRAHLAFHVGLEEVWKAHPLPHCILIRGINGEDKQHVEGTLILLNLLKEGLGKPLKDFKHIPHRNASGLWTYRSPRELGL